MQHEHSCKMIINSRLSNEQMCQRANKMYAYLFSKKKNLVYTLVDMSEMLHTQAFLFFLPEVKERRIPLQIKKKVADVQNAK